MFLVIDAGNSNVKLCGYEGMRCLFFERLPTHRTWSAAQYAAAFGRILAAQPQAPQGAIVSSVVPAATGALLQAAAQLAGQPVYHFGQGMDCGVRVCIDHPAELGDDLLADAAGVLAQGGGLPAIILDLGTATKIIALTGSATVPGVSIAPGVRMGLQAITNGTAVPGLETLATPDHVIGSNTRDSLLSGLVAGTACLLDGMIDRFAAELAGGAAQAGTPQLVATGGLAELVLPLCRHKITLAPRLIPDGLAATYLRALAPPPPQP